jgi:acyl-CoA thioesterase FadM
MVDATRHVPPEYRLWWSTEVQMRLTDFDMYGHVSGASYAALYAEAFAVFAVRAWHTTHPDYVVARTTITYLHEIRPSDCPIRVYVNVRRVGRSSFDVDVVACSAFGRVCSSAETRYSAWDPGRRGSRPLTEAERAGLLAPDGRDGAP